MSYRKTYRGILYSILFYELRARIVSDSTEKLVVQLGTVSTLKSAEDFECVAKEYEVPIECMVKATMYWPGTCDLS